MKLQILFILKHKLPLDICGCIIQYVEEKYHQHYFSYNNIAELDYELYINPMLYTILSYNKLINYIVNNKLYDDDKKDKILEIQNIINNVNQTFRSEIVEHDTNNIKHDKSLTYRYFIRRALNQINKI